jgi:hypothetical protein
MSDSAGGTWVLIGTVNGTRSGTTHYQHNFIRSTRATGSSFTVTFNGAIGNAVKNVYSLFGALGTYSAINSAVNTAQATSVPSVTSPASVAAGDLFYAPISVVSAVNTPVLTSGAGWTQQTRVGNSPTYSWITSQVATSAGQTVSSTGTFANTVTAGINTTIVFYQSNATTGTGAIGLVGTLTDDGTVTYPSRTGTGAIGLVATATDDGAVSFPITATGAISLVATASVSLTYPVTSSSVTEIARNQFSTTPSATTLAGTLTGTMLANDVIIVTVSYTPLSGTTPTITSVTSTNITFTALDAAISNPVPPAATAGIWQRSYIGTLTANSSTQNLTITFSSAITGKSASVMAFRSLTTNQRNADTSVTWLGPTIPSLTSPTLNDNDLLYITSASNQTTATYTPATDTTLGTWSTRVAVASAVGGGSSANTMTQYKVVNSSGTVTFTAGTAGTTGTRYSLTQAFAIIGESPGISLIASATDDGFVTYPRTATGVITFTATATVQLKFPTGATGSITLAGITNDDGAVEFIETASASFALTAIAEAQLLQTTGSAELDLSGTTSNQLEFNEISTGYIDLTATTDVQLVFETQAYAIIETIAIADCLLSDSTSGSAFIDISSDSVLGQLLLETSGTGFIDLSSDSVLANLLQSSGSASININASPVEYTFEEIQSAFARIEFEASALIEFIPGAETNFEPIFSGGGGDTGTGVTTASRIMGYTRNKEEEDLLSLLGLL